MTVRELQQWLVGKGAGIVIDGQGGPATRAAILAVFTNKEAPAVDQSDIDAFAAQIGISPKQMAAIAKVESAGGGFTASGLPKILYERHYFWRLTQHRYGITAFSNPKRGGYNEDSWTKLCLAACKDPHAAFQSASWGKFQVMGAHWFALGYPSPIAMAYSFTRSEADHYEALVRFLKANKLIEEAQAISADPEDNRAFCRAYNGSAYEENRYHLKLAEAMK